MANISTIDPSGAARGTPTGVGQRFTTLAAWQTYAAAQATADQWAECYSGGNLGSVNLTGWASVPSASVHPRIYAATGSRHDGKLSGSSGTNGAYILGTTTARALDINIPFVEIDGLVINKDTALGTVVSIAANGHDYTFKNNIVRRNAGNTTRLFSDAATTSPTVMNLLYNNIFFMSPATYSAGISAVVVGDNNGGGLALCVANTVLMNQMVSFGLLITYAYGGLQVLNNFVYGSDFSTGKESITDSQDSGSFEHTAQYFRNLTDDGKAAAYEDSADYPNATGPITDYIASSTDPTPVVGSLLVDTGDDLNITFGLASVDAVGHSRPFALWDRGAIEYVAATTGGGRHRRRMTELYL